MASSALWKGKVQCLLGVFELHGWKTQLHPDASKPAVAVASTGQCGNAHHVLPTCIRREFGMLCIVASRRPCQPSVFDTVNALRRRTEKRKMRRNKHHWAPKHRRRDAFAFVTFVFRSFK